MENTGYIIYFTLLLGKEETGSMTYLQKLPWLRVWPLSLVMGLLFSRMCFKKPKNSSQYSDTTAGSLKHAYTPLVDWSHCSV